MAKTKNPARDLWAPHIHPTLRFFWGLTLIGCLVFASRWEAKAVLSGLGLALALGSGKQVNLWYFAFLVISVVVFHLILPFGKVWWLVGTWPITEGAFFLGLGKGLTFAGLVFLSLASISRQLRLPGRFGALWGQTFSWYEQLMDQRRLLKPRALLLSLDRLLERLYPTREPLNSAVKPPALALPVVRTSVLGWILVVLTAGLGFSVSVFWP